jgi:hypothetical protein
VIGREAIVPTAGLQGGLLPIRAPPPRRREAVVVYGNAVADPDDYVRSGK